MPSSSNPIEGTLLDPARCPICGEPNNCALAAHPNAAECWCDSEKFPPGLLAQVPGNAVHRACICRNCLEKYLKSIYLPDDPP